MALGRWDIQFRTPYAGNPDGYYYWTNTFYVDVPDPAHAGPAIARLIEGYTIVNFYAIERNWHRLAVPPGHTPYIFDSSMANQHGNTTLTDPFILENVARVHFFAGDEYVGYKLLRGTVAENEVTDGVLSSGAVDRIENNLTFYWFQDDLRTHEGVVIDSLVCDPFIHHWNLRHGTKRRERGVIHNP